MIKKEPKTETVIFRTTKELKKRLEGMAAKDARTLSDYLHLMLEKLTSKEK